MKESKESVVKNKKTIVYVDDIQFSLLTLRDRLKDNYDVLLAQSVEIMFEVLENLWNKKTIIPEMILLDINMPEVDGFQAICELKQNELYNQVPVVILSSRSDKKTMLNAINHGAVDFITKPFTDTDLISCIQYQLEPEKQKEKKPVILAVDDNPSILVSIKLLLKNKYIIYLLEESQSVKEVIKRIAPDIFILDCNMPVLSGYDLVPIIRETAGYSETPIIYLTSDGTLDNVSAAIASGASDFIVKPINEEVLLEKLAANLDGYTIRRRIRELEINPR